jgi:hypothetical protein
MFTLLQFPGTAHAQTSSLVCKHGMRVVGDQSIYVSHMRLFNVPCHKFQAIFEVSFSGANNPQKIYLDEQAKDPKKNEFTIEPRRNLHWLI